MDTQRIAILQRGGLLALVSMLLGFGLAATWLGGGRAAGGEVFLVTSSDDASDDLKGDCLCHTSGGTCTLRAAIEEANACPGGQNIHFDFQWVIQPNTALPKITDDYTMIDGSDHWLTSPSGMPFPGVKIEGLGKNFSGLVITSTHNAVYGVQVVGFGQHGLHLYDEAAFNQIGGTGERQRNIISANGYNGVYIYGSQAVSNTVEANFIGLSPVGELDPFGSITIWGNSWHGVSFWYGEHNVARNNWIADSGWSGAAVDYANDVRIEFNFIGLDFYLQPAGNGYYGVHVDHGAQAEILGNRIAFNRRGVYAAGGSYPIINYNKIYSNNALSLSPASGGGILLQDTTTSGQIIFNEIYSNTAASGSGIGARGGADASIYRNLLFANNLDTSGDFEGSGAIYFIGGEADIQGNHIFSNRFKSDKSAATLLFGGGICLFQTGESIIRDNMVNDNHLQAHEGGGGGIAVLDGALTIIEQNQVFENSVDTDLGGGSGILLSNPGSPSPYDLDRNWIAFNQGQGGALRLQYESAFTMTNSLVVRNDDDGVYLDQVSDYATLNHNTIADNNGSGIVLDASWLKLTNSILAGNSGYGLEALGSLWVLASGSNDAWGNSLGDSNSSIAFSMTLDPRFIDSLNENYGLRPGSPCLDQADAYFVEPSSYNGLPRPQGYGPDLGAFEMGQSYLPMMRK